MSYKAAHAFIAIFAATLPTLARADTVDARCDIYPKGSDRASAMLPCSFSQRQGHVYIQRSDGIAYELALTEQGPAAMSMRRAAKPLVPRWRTWMATAGPSCMST